MSIPLCRSCPPSRWRGRSCALTHWPAAITKQFIVYDAIQRLLISLSTRLISLPRSFLSSSSSGLIVQRLASVAQPAEAIDSFGESIHLRANSVPNSTLSREPRHGELADHVPGCVLQPLLKLFLGRLRFRRRSVRRGTSRRNCRSRRVPCERVILLDLLLDRLHLADLDAEERFLGAVASPGLFVCSSAIALSCVMTSFLVILTAAFAGMVVYFPSLSFDSAGDLPSLPHMWPPTLS